MGNRYGAGNPAYDGLNRLTQFNGAAIQHDLLGNRLQDGKWAYVWDALNRLVGMNPKAGNPDNRLYSFVYRADGLRVKKVWHTPIEVAPAEALASGPSKVRTEEEEAKPVYIGHEVDYLYDGQMPVCEQEFEDGVLQQTRVNFLGARGIEAVLTVDHARGNQVRLDWLLYDGHGNLVRLMSPDYTLSAFQWRGVWGEVQGSLGTGRGYCANLGHPEDETGLVYMRARYYEPATGRFISEDPARDGLNWYLYADGNPVNRVDMDGQDDSREWYALGVAMTALAVIYAMLIPAARVILKELGGDLSTHIAATLGAIAGGSLTAICSIVAIYAFMKALERVLEVRIYTTLTPNAHKRPNAKRTQRTYNQHSRLATLAS